MAKLNKDEIAMNLLTSRTINEAADRSSVSTSTLYRLRKQASFQKILTRVKDELFQETMKKAQSYALDSLEVLREVAVDEDANDSSRVSAARTIIDIGLAANEQEHIIHKLDDLERRLMDD
ncbi:hypothetical protein LMF32_12000 [Desemzia sp. C1]|uniref:hypothetical protein n=1 Tax=Desemzia sp. C1 TaxID=2892016 RepID=UPI001E37CE01|nr:hypothetical protein [Desemzia sp. C1]MCI3029767.1 hypothetical protein [Desemzia sp. C1]